VKTRAILFLCCALSLSTSVSAYGSFGAEDNPFLEAMLRMMEVFGLIDRSAVPLGAPYLPSYGQSIPPGLGGLQGLGGWPGYPAMGGFPGMSPLGGPGSLPGTGLAPGVGWPGSGFPHPGKDSANWMNFGWQGKGGNSAESGFLDGIWELSNGGFAVIKRRSARLYLSKERYQDFTIGYDQQHFWWTPRGGNTTSHYRYQFRDGRMILRDNQGKMLLMRRRS
jgi:hypothetical protein